MKVLFVCSATKSEEYYKSKLYEIISMNESFEVYFMFRRHIIVDLLVAIALIIDETGKRFPVYAVCETEEEMKLAHENLEFLQNFLTIKQCELKEMLFTADIIA